jgi:membrane-associated phospholipid phosphatase
VGRIASLAPDRPRPGARPRPRPSWRPALVAALGAFAALALTGVLAHRSPAAQSSDAEGLRGFHSLDYGPFSPVAEAVAHLGGPAGYALGGLLLVLLALGSRRPRVAAAVAVVLAGTAASTRLLKPLIDTPRYGPDGRQLFLEAWPSGHATAAMTLALCGVLVAPAAVRGLAALLGAAFAVATAFAVLVLARHLPSDIVGGFLMAAGWALLASAALQGAQERWPSGTRAYMLPSWAERARRAATARGTVLAAGAGGLALVPVIATTTFATRYTTALLGGIAIAALAAVLALGVSRALAAAPRAA